MAVELALAGDPTAMRLCIERILPPCRERAVKFTPPPSRIPTISLPRCRRSPPHSPEAILHRARRWVVETFARTDESTKRRGFAVDPL
jgi:hypothetical protein